MKYLRFPASTFETLANLLETFPDALKESLIYSKSFLIYLRLILTCFDIPFEVFETLSIGDPSRCILCFCHCCFLPHLKACRILVPRPGVEPTPCSRSVEPSILDHQRNPPSGCILNSSWGIWDSDKFETLPYCLRLFLMYLKTWLVWYSSWAVTDHSQSIWDSSWFWDSNWCT